MEWIEINTVKDLPDKNCMCWFFNPNFLVRSGKGVTLKHFNPRYKKDYLKYSHFQIIEYEHR